MTKKIIFGLLWLGFGTYAFGFAPPDQPQTAQLIQNLIAGKLDGINPAIAALFNLMGILPMIYASILFCDGRGQKVPAWIFTTLAFGIGAFGLLPYMALREPNPKFVGEKSWLIKFFDSRWLGLVLTILAVYLVGWGLREGDWLDFWQQFQTNRFIHVMSLDFLMLCLLFPWLLGDDMQRRGMDNMQIFYIVSIAPLFGALAYLCVRSPLGNAASVKV